MFHNEEFYLKQNTGEIIENSRDQCEEGGKDFRINNVLKKHLKIYKGIENSCDKCEYKSTKTQHINSHKKIKHETIKQCCDQCYLDILDNQIIREDKNAYKENDANTKFTSDIISLHRLTRRHAANDLIVLHCTNMKQTLLSSLFIIYINYKQTMKWTKYMEMDIGSNKTHYNKTKMLQARIHFQYTCTLRRSSRNWNGILCDFI